MVERKEEWWVPAADTRATASADIPPIKKPGGPRSIWAPRRVREVGAQFPDRQGRDSPPQACSKPKSFSERHHDHVNRPLMFKTSIHAWVSGAKLIIARGTPGRRRIARPR